MTISSPPMKRVREAIDNDEHRPKLPRGDLRNYMIRPESTLPHLPHLPFDMLVNGVMAALGALDFPTFVAMAMVCKTIYHTFHWRQYAVRINGGRRHWKREYFELFAPYVVEFDYALPCHHGWNPLKLAGCPRLTTLALFGAGCYSGMWMLHDDEEDFFPASLTRLTLHNYPKYQINRRAYAAIPFGQLTLVECQGKCEWDPTLLFNQQGFFHKHSCTCLPERRIPYE
jgi:hypothetical protein